MSYDGRRLFCLFDDAMVSMRYGWNLVHGQGLVWNPGERVEGYTNLLHTLLMAVFILLFGKVNAVLAVQVAGVVALVVNALFGLRIAERMSREAGLRVSPVWRTLYVAIPLVYYPLAYWSLMGMETGVLAALVTATAWYGLSAPDDRVSWPLGALTAAACLTRPDAVIPVGLILLFRFAALRRERRSVSVMLIEAGTAAAVILAVLIARRLYYGAWVPNTYILKVTGYSLGFRIRNGWAFTAPFLKTVALPLAIALAGLLLRPARSAGLLVALFAAAVGYQIWIGGDAWSYWRFLASSVPLLVLVALVQLRAAVEVRTGSPRWRERAVVLAVLAIALWNLNAAFFPEMVFRVLPFDVDANQKAVNVGLALNQVTTDAATVGVFRAGAIPYFAERRGVDFLGKSDPHIARLSPDLRAAPGRMGMQFWPGHSKFDLNYSILGLRPTYVERVERGGQSVESMAALIYTRKFYRGVRLNLLKGSPAVRWDQLDEPETTSAAGASSPNR
jgi:arabinofuranosyltransferase